MANEDLLHYVWKFKLYQKDLKTTQGELIEVIDVGLSNTDAGPDFFNAKVKIGEKLWAGNVEIHCSSSDWNKHKHDSNHAYDSVILHVVEKADTVVYTQSQREIPQCEIVYPQHIKDNYDMLSHNNIDIPCANYIRQIPSIHLSHWMESLLVERLERKANHIFDLLSQYENSWDDVFYILLSRNLGFGLNSDSFERLAKSLPLKYLQKQGDNIVQIEALLFGQAGILDNVKHVDDYVSLLHKEYAFLSNKYEIKPLNSIEFKSLRARPSAFPEIRIAQLAMLIYNLQGLFSRIIEIDDIGRIRLLFHVNASEYWQTHYQLGSVSTRKSKYLGDSSLDIILINTVIPILFAYGKYTANESLCDRALLFLEIIKAEQNSITKQFSKMGMPLMNAADSQALIQLKKEYCAVKKCLYCRIGHRLMIDK